MLKRLKRKEEESSDKKRISSMLSKLSLDDSRRSPNRLRVPWKRRDCNSEDSARSDGSAAGGSVLGVGSAPGPQGSTASKRGSHTPTSSIMGVQSALYSMATPFPLVRSHSSISGVTGAPQEQRGRSLTDGEPPLDLQSLTTEEQPLPPFDDTTDPVAYLLLLESQGRGGKLCQSLAQFQSAFLQEVMHTYVATQFNFTNEPIDIALRKFLLVVKLPLETQQTERVLESFSRVYHEQNPWVFSDDQQAYFVVFSIVILHTDFFNKNVKHKMTKEDYVRSAYCEDIPLEFFEYIYDNTTCAQFIHAEDEATGAAAGGTAAAAASAASSIRKGITGTPTIPFTNEDTSSLVGRRSTSFGWRSDLMVDPYILILENNTTALRPHFGTVVATTDPFVPCFVETPQQLLSLRQRFIEGPTIQLVSQRSRPDAWQGELPVDHAAMSTQDLLQLTTPGVVEIKVVKIGILLRRESSKRMLYQKSSWKEWGALLTESQLYLFKNVAWIKSMLETQSSTIIRAPIDEFNATTISSTKDMAAMYMASSSTDQANQFILTGRGGSQQWFACRDDDETIDWIHNINFASAFSTYHVGPAPAPKTAETLARSASDTSLKPPLSRNAPQPARTARTQALNAQLREIDRKIASIQEQVNVIERDSNNLQMLMPLQQKTKEMVMFAVGQCSSKCEYCWLDRARLRCYKNMLELDLRYEEECMRPQLRLKTPDPDSADASRYSSPLHTPDHLKADDSHYTDAQSVLESPARLAPVESEGVYIAAGRQFSFVNMNPDLIHSSPRSSSQSVVSGAQGSAAGAAGSGAPSPVERIVSPPPAMPLNPSVSQQSQTL